MRFFNLFGRSDRRTHTCPHCEHDFKHPPKGKRKCPECGTKLSRWKDDDNEQTLLVTEAQKRDLQRSRVRGWAERALNELRSEGIKQAEIVAAMDNRSTQNCLAADGQVLSVAKAMKEMPIPHDGEGECRCCFVGHFE